MILLIFVIGILLFDWLNIGFCFFENLVGGGIVGL